MEWSLFPVVERQPGSEFLFTKSILYIELSISYRSSMEFVIYHSLSLLLIQCKQPARSLSNLQV